MKTNGQADQNMYKEFNPYCEQSKQIKTQKPFSDEIEELKSRIKEIERQLILSSNWKAK
jgi:polyhydroxyalkanoate synthesis regulator protein